MKFPLLTLAAGVAAVTAGPASAADWWLLSGVPTQPAAIFADVDSLTRDGDTARMTVLRIDRHGRAYQIVQRIQCDRNSGSVEGEDVRQFACATEKERDEHGLILASMSPALVARMIFDGDPTVTAEAGRKAKPRT